MVLTKEHLEAIAAAALPIDYGSITIQIGASNSYIDIDALQKIRVKKEPSANSDRRKPVRINT